MDATNSNRMIDIRTPYLPCMVKLIEHGRPTVLSHFALGRRWDGDSVPTGVVHILRISETEGEGPKDAVGQMEMERRQ